MLMNLNPTLKLVVNDEKMFKSVASMLFGKEELVVKATDMVEQLKRLFLNQNQRSQPVICLATTPETIQQQQAMGVGAKVAKVITNLTRSSTTQDQVCTQGLKN